MTVKSKIERLSDITINRIAAGEVVERPSSVVKELVENSLDAGATDVTIKIESGGRNLISVADNGCGMSPEDLSIAVDKHTTSKLKNNDLLDIKYFGFRGEALPSIASVSRMTIKSLARDSNEAWKIEVLGGEKKNIAPVKCSSGTVIEINDLFFATPARLKFLRSEVTEVKHIQDTLKRIAFAHPDVSFSLFVDNKLSLEFKASKQGDFESRVEAILGKSFKENSIAVNINSEGIDIKGFISLPTYDRGTSNEQYLYINKRPVKDKMLLSAIRVAYKDFISRDRYPVVVLFMDVPFHMVDVNVHPAKTEVRFRDFNMMRSLLINGLKNSLQSGGQKASSTIAEATLNSMYSEPMVNREDLFVQNSYRAPAKPGMFSSHKSNSYISKPTSIMNELMANFSAPVARGFEENRNDIDQYQHNPLGAARCQLHECYIIAQTDDSVVIVDQHAAHERLTYEKLKKVLSGGFIDSQRLLIPEMIESDEDTIEKVLSIKEKLAEYGLVIEPCTTKSIIVTSVPFVLEGCNIQKIIRDLLDDIIEFEDNITFREMIQEKLATYACHHSIRSGRKMNIEEMNSLLREMEQVNHSGQCNHGRPTYIKLKLTDIEKLFGRS
jgi:DNA mismatch repair protein MutL